MDNTIDTLDFLYVQSLEEDLCEQDRAYIVTAMEGIAKKCDEWLAQTKFALTAEAKMRFAVLKKMATDTIDEVQRGIDCLIHWTKMRDYMATLAPAIRAFQKKAFDKPEEA